MGGGVLRRRRESACVRLLTVSEETKKQEFVGVASPRRWAWVQALPSRQLSPPPFPGGSGACFLSSAVAAEGVSGSRRSSGPVGRGVEDGGGNSDDGRLAVGLALERPLLALGQRDLGRFGASKCRRRGGVPPRHPRSGHLTVGGRHLSLATGLREVLRRGRGLGGGWTPPRQVTAEGGRFKTHFLPPDAERGGECVREVRIPLERWRPELPQKWRGQRRAALLFCLEVRPFESSGACTQSGTHPALGEISFPFSHSCSPCKMRM